MLFKSLKELVCSVGYDLDLDVERTRVVIEVTLINAQEKGTVAGRDEFAFGTDIDKVVVVVADHRDQSTGRDVLEQLLIIVEFRNARRR